MKMVTCQRAKFTQIGFSLVEILVGLGIGLIVSLVIMQTFATFEGQKRSTAGMADTQTNGSIALYNVMRDVQMAGFGLPLFNPVTSPVKCDVPPTIDHDNDAGTPKIGLFPIVLIDGGTTAGASDQIAVRYGYTYTAPNAANRRKTAVSGTPVEFASIPGVSVDILNPNNATSTGIEVSNNRGCQNGDVVLASKLTGSVNACMLTRVASTNAELDVEPPPLPAAQLVKLKLTEQLSATPNSYADGSLACLGRWTEIRYRVNNNFLEKSGLPDDSNNGIPDANFVPNVADIVNIQAQYGISETTTSNQIINWVNPTGIWDAAAISFLDQNRIKAVRIAVVARSGLLEKTIVTNNCTTSQGTINKGPCAWDDTVATDAAQSGVNAGDRAPKIDLSNDSNWGFYRYRVYETIIPIRNVAWNRGNL